MSLRGCARPASCETRHPRGRSPTLPRALHGRPEGLREFLLPLWARQFPDPNNKQSAGRWRSRRSRFRAGSKSARARKGARRRARGILDLDRAKVVPEIRSPLPRQPTPIEEQARLPGNRAQTGANGLAPAALLARFSATPKSATSIDVLSPPVMLYTATVFTFAESSRFAEIVSGQFAPTGMKTAFSLRKGSHEILFSGTVKMARSERA